MQTNPVELVRALGRLVEPGGRRLEPGRAGPINGLEFEPGDDRVIRKIDQTGGGREARPARKGDRFRPGDVLSIYIKAACRQRICVFVFENPLNMAPT